MKEWGNLYRHAHTISGLGSSKVLVLGTWYLMRIIEYLVLTCTWSFEIQKYLVLTCTWWPKYLILVQVLKYFCQVNKYSVLNLWISSCQQFTSEHHKQKCLILGVLRAYVSGCQQSRLDCLLDLQAQNWDPMTQYTDKILAIIGSGSDLSPVWDKPLQPNW